jgi:hypothetical protein
LGVLELAGEGVDLLPEDDTGSPLFIHWLLRTILKLSLGT